MILSEIKTYIKTNQRVSLLEISQRFDVQAKVARDMLQHWVRKGNIKRVDDSNACGTKCTQCDPKSLEEYQWLGTHHEISNVY